MSITSFGTLLIGVGIGLMGIRKDNPKSIAAAVVIIIGAIMLVCG